MLNSLSIEGAEKPPQHNLGLLDGCMTLAIPGQADPI